MLLLLVLIPCLIMIDVTFRFSLGGYGISPYFSTIVLFYVGFRKEWQLGMVLVLVFSVFSHTFTYISFLRVLIPYLVGVFVINKMREKIFVDGKFILAFWVFFFGLILQGIIYLELMPLSLLISLDSILFHIVLQSFVMAVLSIPVFSILDFIFKEKKSIPMNDRKLSI